MTTLRNYKNKFLFHLKSSFRSRDIQIFVIFSLPFHISRFIRTNGSGIICYELGCIKMQVQILENSKTALYQTIKLGQVLHS